MRPDETVSPGRTGVQVSRLGVGCAWFGNQYQAVPEDAAAAVLALAFELGFRLVDTAPLYGFGLADRRIAPALAVVSRDSFVLSTKVGRTLRARRPDDPPDRGYDGNGPLLLDAPDLRVEFDIVLMHDPDDHYAQAVDGAFRAVHSLRDEGVVGA